MADWFKIDAHLIDDPKVRYCTSIHCESLGVFLWCLCECCRQRSDRFEWLNSPAEVRGLSLVLNIPDAKVVSCLTTLDESTLIKCKEGLIIVKRWEKHQSDYLNRREYFSDRYQKQKSTVKHSEKSEKCEFTQRRGEERRVDKIDDLPSEVAFWNSQEKLPKVQTVSPDRQKSLKARRTDPFFVEHYQEAVLKITQSKFCLGNNDRAWKADFDWILRPGTVAKIMEGKYAERTPINGRNTPENSRNAGMCKPITPVAEVVRRREAEALARQVAEATNGAQQTFSGT